MINLVLAARADAEARYVVRLNDRQSNEFGANDALLVDERPDRKIYSSAFGLLEIRVADESCFDRDVVSVDPQRGLVERLVRSSSPHNTFLATERCDQLCVMCSQPPKKTHVDRWAEFETAARLAPPDALLGISGGEPTLFRRELFALIEAVQAERPDLSWHILSNGQHFCEDDISQLSSEAFSRVTWGIPIYAAAAPLHDEIVGKEGAYRQLREGLDVLLRSGAHVELRTVVLSSNFDHLPALAHHAGLHLGFCDQWSIMQLEAAGFAKNRFADLFVPTAGRFAPIGGAIDVAELYGLPVALFNFPRCHIPKNYRGHAVASISDWKRKFASACAECHERSACGGFFEWHPAKAMEAVPL